MNTHADKTQENKSQAVSATGSQMQSVGESAFQFADNRPEAVAQRKLKETANNSSKVSQLRALQDMANNSPQTLQAAQLQAMADNPSARQQPIQKKENNTGLPDNLKTGIEKLSGMPLDDVKVHRNSDKPAQLQAHAYAQGTDIHLGPGQEKHLPHEAWHVVQQKQGRVKPTMQMKGKVHINDDEGLEKEADVMGAKAIQAKSFSAKQEASTFQNSPRIVAQRETHSAGYESASGSAMAAERNASNRTPEQLEEAYGDALKKGLDRFTKLDAPKEMAVDKEEKGKPPEEYVVQTKGEIIYNHKIQVGEGKQIHVVTQVFLKKGEGFVPEKLIEEPKEKKYIRENKKRKMRNDAEILQVGSFGNYYGVKDKKITGIIAASNEKTNIAQEGQKEINMTEIVKQQCQLAINFKQNHIKGIFNSWKTKAEDNVNEKVDPGETHFPITIERSPTPSTDTSAVLAYIKAKNPIEPNNVKIALFGTAHAVVPNVLAKENGITSRGIQVKIDGDKILYTLSR